MKNPDAVLRELGQLYDFQQEVARFRFRKKTKSNKAAARDRRTARLVPRSAASGT
jgi:hypothetical protein